MKKVILFFAVVVGIVISAVIYLVSTESGLGILLGQVQRWQPAGVTAQSASGRLIGPLTISGFQRESEQNTITIESIGIDWQLPSAWRRTLHIRSAQISGVRALLKSNATAPDSDAAERFTLPQSLQLPIDIVVDDLQVIDVKVLQAQGTKPIELKRIKLASNFTRDQKFNVGLNVESHWLNVDAQIDAETKNGYPVSGAIDWLLSQPELAPLKGKTTISGDLQELRIAQMVEPPYGVDATVVLNDPLNNLTLNTVASINISDLSLIKSGLPSHTIGSTWQIRGAPLDAQISASVAVDGILPHTLNANLVARTDGALVHIAPLELSIENSPTILSAQGSIDFATNTPQVNTTITWSDAQWPLDAEPVVISESGKVNVTGPIGELLSTLSANVGTKGTLKAEAKQNGASVSLKVDWQDMAWPADGSQINEAAGTLLLEGAVSDYEFGLDSMARSPSVGNLSFSTAGRGSSDEVEFIKLQATAIAGQFDGKAKVSWLEGLTFDASIEGKGIDPSSIDSEYPGDIDLSARISGESSPQDLELSLEQLSINGVLRAIPLEIEAVGGSIGKHLTLDQLSLNTGTTQFLVDGTVTDTVALNWMLDSPDLANVLPNASGRLRAKGKIGGTIAAPSIDAMLTGSSLAVGELKIQSVDAQALINSLKKESIDVKLTVAGVKSGNVKVSKVDAQIDGNFDQHVLSLTARSNQGDVDLELNGQLYPTKWTSRINRLKINPRELNPWALSKFAVVGVNKEGFSLSQLCLSSGEAELCANAQALKDSVVADYKLQQFPISYIRRWVPSQIAIQGNVNSHGRWQSLAGSAPEANVEAVLTNVTIDAKGPEDEKIRVLTAKPSSLKALLNKQGMDASAELDLGTQGAFNATLTAKGSPQSLATTALSGGVKGELRDIGFVAAFLPDVENMAGRLQTDIKFDGTLKKPVLRGGIRLENGSAELATPGLVIQDIQALVNARSGTALDIAANATSGEGSLRVKGTIDLAASNPELSVAISGNRFEVLNTLEARAAISPAIDLLVKDKRVYFNGDVAVPLLEITPKKLPKSVARVSSDQVIVTQRVSAQGKKPVLMQGTLNVSLGDRVYIDALGLQASLSGDIRVKESPGVQTTATGKLNIDEGLFKAYGQNLRIEKGQILYAGGPINQPGFDIEAVRYVTSELNVGVRARGAIDNPQFSLFSTPPMSESEQMSYLVLGRPLENNSPSENSAVRQAAMALGVAGGKLLTEKIGNRLGLDQVAIGSELRETGEQAALVIGKYISPKLFVSYGAGLFEPVSTLRLNYTINRNVKLVSETTESRRGGDIVFTFDSDK